MRLPKFGDHVHAGYKPGNGDIAPHEEPYTRVYHAHDAMVIGVHEDNVIDLVQVTKLGIVLKVELVDHISCTTSSISSSPGTLCWDFPVDKSGSLMLASVRNKRQSQFLIDNGEPLKCNRCGTSHTHSSTGFAGVRIESIHLDAWCDPCVAEIRKQIKSIVDGKLDK